MKTIKIVELQVNQRKIIAVIRIPIAIEEIPLFSLLLSGRVRCAISVCAEGFQAKCEF